ncbi:hypothetical protein ACV4QK_20755 (plasmid) [Alteromonas macleodii]|jgi:hypothetical protein
MLNDQEFDLMIDEIMSDLLEVKVESVICSSNCYSQKTGVRIFPICIEIRLYALEAKLRAHLDAYCIQCIQVDHVSLFTISLVERDEIMEECFTIISEFDRRVIEIYKQYSEILTPYFTQEQWCKQNTLSVTVQKINF